MEIQNSVIGLWVDDIRNPPFNFWYKGKEVHWMWAKSVETAKHFIQLNEEKDRPYDLLSLDHDAGEYYKDGGDYINILNWLEEMGYNFPIHIHSMNPVGVSNMRAIIEKNGWKEIR